MSVGNAVGWAFRNTIELFFGHQKLWLDGYNDYPYSRQNPFKSEYDQWQRDPFYRRGLVGAPFTRQFWQDLVGALARHMKSSF